ncbi:MAG: alkaline phosphatase D family protein [Halobacteriota archaeon]
MSNDSAKTDGRTRREVIESAGRVTLAGVLAAALKGTPVARPIPIAELPEPSTSESVDSFSTGPGERSTVYPQSVSSGDPTTSGVIVWTRIDPEAYDSTLSLDLEVAADERFSRRYRRYQLPPSRIRPENDFTVSVDLDGDLDSDTEYYYRFVYDEVPSETGRCRTLPAPWSTPDSVRLAVVNCQDFRNGYYGAFRHVAAEDVDFILHLGDFIYEKGGESSLPDRAITLPSGEEAAMDLDDYRHLYRTYRSDGYLQAAMEQHTMIPTWDDHELVNDCAWDYRTDSPQGTHPIIDDPEAMRQLIADAIRAWWEYVPSRARYRPEEERLHDQMRLWRSFRFGTLAELLVTDERLFRSPPSGGSKPTRRPTMLGPKQRAWFTDRIRDSTSTWTVWANEVLLSTLSNGPMGDLYVDARGWDGYPDERSQILETVRESDVENFVALSGDLHTSLAGYLQESYPSPENPVSLDSAETDRVGVEFMAPPVTSQNLKQLHDLPEGDQYEQFLEDLVSEKYPHIDFFNSYCWGYAVVEFSVDDCTFTAYSVDRTADPAHASKSVLRSLRVPNGRVAIYDR